MPNSKLAKTLYPLDKDGKSDLELAEGKRNQGSLPLISNCNDNMNCTRLDFAVINRWLFFM